MEIIIHAFLEESIKLIKKNIGNVLKDKADISEFVELVKKATDELGRNIIKTVLEEIDEQLVKSPARKKNWNIQSRNDEKSILTKLGLITYLRTYFVNKGNKEYRYLVDEVFGIEPHERMDAGMETKLIELSSEMSFRKSGEIASEIEISGQTVMNKLRDREELKVEKVADKKSEIEVLYVEADEDHISLQKGNLTNSKLIYVHEGIKTNGKRNSLKNPFYVSSVTSSLPTLWGEVWEYIRNNYNVDKIKRIYLQGDGAKWIRQGLEYLPNAKFVLDRYHMNKYILQATGQNKKYFSKLWNCLNRVNREEFIQTIEKLLEESESANRTKAINDCRGYMLNNWDGIEVQVYEDKYMIGCSAEGHVSHVLSARMSSRPLSWTLQGGDDMARLRAFMANRGNVYEAIKLEKQEKTCKLITKKLLTEAKKRVKRKFNEGLNNIEILRQGRRTELFEELKRLRFKAI